MQISIRELKANPARAIALMHQGERVQITSHRKVVAELVVPKPDVASPPPVSDQEALSGLLASGRVSEPASQPWLPRSLLKWPASPDGKTLSDLVIEGRGPR